MATFFTTLKEYLEFLIDVLELNNLKLVLVKIGAVLLAFLSPLQPILYSVLFLILVDAITGIIAARHQKETITSSKLSRTISKIMVYLVTIIVVDITNKYLLFGPDAIPLEGLVTGYIALTELKSIIENLDKMSSGKHTALKSIIRIFSNERQRSSTPRRKRVNSHKPRK